MSTVDLILFVVVVCGQPGVPPGVTADAALGEPHVDGTYGYSICPPKGWQVVRQRVAQGRSLALLRIVNAADQTRGGELTVRRMVMVRADAVGKVLDRIYHGLELEFADVKVLSQQVQEIAGRSGGLLAVTYWRDGIRQMRLHAIIERGSGAYYELLYGGPAAGRREREALFYLVLDSFRVLDDRLSETDLAEAVGAGRAWMSSLDADAVREAMLASQYLRIDVDGQACGYLHLSQEAGRSHGRDGVRVSERSWLFEPGGRVHRTQSNVFVSYDLGGGEWKTSATVLVPASERGRAFIENVLEEGLRSQQMVLSSQAHGLDRPVVQNPALQMPNTYIPRGLMRMLPQLIGDLSRPRRLAFVEFDHQRCDTVVRVVELKGRSDSAAGSAGGETFLIELYESPAGEPSKMHVDRAGRLVSVRIRNTTMVAAPEAALEKRFGRRVAEAGREMARLEEEHDRGARRFGPASRTKKSQRP